MTRASILIRTKNEAKFLAGTLELVLSQSHARKEVLVIDSGSSDGTLDIADRYPVAIATIDPSEWSYPKALNLGASRTSGDVIVCLSAHCRPVDDVWLANLLRHFADEKVAGVWGPNVHHHRQAAPPGPPVRQHPGTYTYETRLWGLSNANSAVRRVLWEQFPFDERLPATEDKAWGMAAMSRGYDIVYDPAAGVHHEPHSVSAAYHRNRAVVEGFNMLFPQERRHTSGSLPTLARAAWRTAYNNLRRPNLDTLRRDVRRGISTISAVVGGYAGDKAKREQPPDR